MRPAARSFCDRWRAGRWKNGRLLSWSRSFAATFRRGCASGGRSGWRRSAPTGGGARRELQVLPDVLAVGSDADSVRICLTLQSAQRVADALGCLLPTPRISDEIHRQAALKVPPDPLTHERESIATMLRHSRILDARIRGAAAGALVAGGKKDVVITNRLLERPGRVAIYGWHHPDGRPVQPLSIVHTDRYVDYSHGIRLVRRAMTVDGRAADLAEVLQDPVLWPLVSGEGPLKVIRY